MAMNQNPYNPVTSESDSQRRASHSRLNAAGSIASLALLFLGLFLYGKAHEATVGISRRYATYVPEYEFPLSIVYSNAASYTILGLALITLLVTIANFVMCSTRH